MDSLELLSKLRNHEMESALWTVWNDSLGGGAVDMKKSLTNYISECTAIKFSLGESNEDQINTENWRTALRFDSQIYGADCTCLHLARQIPVVQMAGFS